MAGEMAARDDLEEKDAVFRKFTSGMQGPLRTVKFQATAADSVARWQRRYCAGAAAGRASDERNGGEERKVEGARQYAAKLKGIIDQLPYDDVERISDLLYRAYTDGRTVFVFGNGGSAALASHLACDLGKGTAPAETREGSAVSVRRLRMMSLTDNVPTISAWGNDASFEDIFARQLENFVQPQDVAFGISGSGNSPNILKALRLARARQAVTAGFSGRGGKMIELLDCAAVVPSNHMQLIEDCHLIMMHMVFLDLKERIAKSH
jgi:D-sedoheptulose 7-phosphate isomerase